MSVTTIIGKLADRTAVLFVGVAVGAAIGYAFAGSGGGAGPAERAAPAARPQPQAVAVSAASRARPMAAPPSAELIEAVADGGRIRVGVFGDSFGDGLWAALYHQLPAKDGYEVEKFSRQSTGFTRYASLNLERHLAEQLATEKVDIAVISYGANDTQGVIRNGKYAALLSPGWKLEIGERIARYVAKLRASGAAVYWVGLPAMRKPSFDADIAGLNDFYAAEMAKLGVPFIETRSLTVDASGAYAAYLPDPKTGKQRLMRANDGVHMSMGGYARLTDGLARQIRSTVGAVRAQAADKAPKAPVSASGAAGSSGA